MRDDLSSLARTLGRGLGRVKREIDRTIGKTDRPQIVPYRGYANRQNAHINGRVMLDPGLVPARPGEVWWRNLINTYKRMESDELAGARVRVRGFGEVIEVRSNEEGFFRATLPVARAEGPLWQTVELELISPVGPEGDNARVLGQVILPPAETEYGVISDLDDTVIQTGVSSIPRMVAAVALGNAHTRLPFHGVAAFYRALHTGTRGAPSNPIFYVSSSPWNLYDLLEEFLTIRGIPAGPLVLRDWGLGVNPSKNAPHKLEAIAHVLETYPALPFILIGDSGQEDPEIYRETITRFPGRIRAAYIRNVTPHPERSSAIRSLIDEVTAAGSTMVLTDDTLSAARHAVEHGWITEDALAAIVADGIEEDEKGPASHEGAGPTIVVE